MSTNQFKAFGVGPSTPNTLTPTAYAALFGTGGVGQTGFESGLASATQVNTVLRQVSTVATALAQFIVDFAAVSANDDGVPGHFEAGFKAALDALYVPLSALAGYVAQTQFTGGNQNLDTNGFQRFPGGFLLQWGTTGVINEDTEAGVGFEKTFDVVFGALATCDYTGGDDNNDVIGQVRDLGTTGMVVMRNSGGGTNLPGVVRWWAWGKRAAV